MAWIPLAISGVAGIASAFTKKKDEAGFQTAPEYAEATGARENWWQQLKQWGEDPNYGAITPDWGSIWDNAKGKVQRYFWGSATDPGVVNKVRSSLARRNASDGPAAEDLIGRMGIEESNQLKDIGVTQAQTQAQMAEQGRQNWLQSLMSLASQKPNSQYITTPADNTLSNTLGAISGAAGGASTYMQSNQNMSWLQNLLSGQGGQNYANVSGLGQVPVAPANYYLKH